MMCDSNMLVSTTIKDSFFDDPFFKDWWNDFDAPMQSYNKTFNRQISDTPRRSMLDSFFDLKSGKNFGTASSSTSSAASGLSLKDGKFSIRIDIGDFDPEDLDIKVEDETLYVTGERKIQRGNSTISKRCFNQQFKLPPGIDVDKITSELHFGGKLIISAPQLRAQKIADEDDIDKEINKSGAKKTTVSEAEIALKHGGKAKSKSSETEDKKSKVSTVTRTLPDGSSVEETVEEEEVVIETSSSTEMSLSGGKVKPSMAELQSMLKSGAAAGGMTNTTVENTQEKLKTQKGTIIEMSQEQNTVSAEKEMVIPISIQGISSSTAAIEGPKSPKTPKPRFMPFSFTSMGLPDPQDMMAKMQQQVQIQMEQMMQQHQLQVPKAPQVTIQSVSEDLADQDFFVPLKDIGKVQKNALANATAMAKMKGEYFELVVNIQKFTPEEVRVYADTPGKSVLVKAQRKTPEGLTSDSFEQQFSLPEDVDPDKLTSGISRDGILMIRVPKRKSISQERIIPIQYDAKIDAIQKALQQTVEGVKTEMTSEQVQEELIRENIVPLKIEKKEDIMKAASAEVVEALTVGVAEAAGADAGEEAGTKAAASAAQKAIAEVVCNAVTEVAHSVGTEIAGELGAKVAIEAAMAVGKLAGERSAAEIGAEIGREVGRVSGSQAASIAGAEELAKMNLSKITEVEAASLKAKFVELGSKVGTEAGTKAGVEAGKNIDPEVPIKEAKEAASKAAEDAAMKVKSLINMANEEATSVGEEAGSIAGKTAGEIAGQSVAIEAVVKAATLEAVKVAQVIIGERGVAIGDLVGNKIGKEVAAKLGKELGGEVGIIAGKAVGIETAMKIAKEYVMKMQTATLDELKIKELKANVVSLVKEAATIAASEAGKQAGMKINIDSILAEAIDMATRVAEEQALEVKAFETVNSEVAEEAGKKAGQTAGETSGAIAGEKVAVEAVLKQAIDAAIKEGKKIFGEIGGNIGKEAGEIAARKIAIKLGRELGGVAGSEAGLKLGGEAAFAAGKLEAAKYNPLEMKTEEIEKLKMKLTELGTSVGKAAGEAAGTEAGSKIDIPRILKETLEAAVKAAQDAAGLAKASKEETEANELKEIIVNGAKESGELGGEEGAKETVIIKEVVLEEIIKACKVAGEAKGEEVFGGEFGKTIGAQAAIKSAKKAAYEKAKELTIAKNIELGRLRGGEAGYKAGLEEVKKISDDLKNAMSQEKVSSLRAKFSEVGMKAGKSIGFSISKSEESFSQINLEIVKEYAIQHSIAAAEKYAIKAREFRKMAVKIAEEAGAKMGAETGKDLGGEAGEEAGGNAGERVGREAGAKAGQEIAGDEGAKIGGVAGAKVGRAFGLKVGFKAGATAGETFGKQFGRIAGGEAGAAEAMRAFEIGISKERVVALKKLFYQVGAKAGGDAGRKAGKEEGAKAGEEEGSKFAYDEGARAGAAAARKLKAKESKELKEEGTSVGEKEGALAGETAGAEAGEAAGADEAERIGAEEGERLGREIAGEEGAKIGREIGAEMARLAGAKLGKKVGKTAGANAGRKAGKIAGAKAGEEAAKEISRDKVDALRKMFASIAANAGKESGAIAARREAIKSVGQIALETAAKAAREKILALASQGQITLSASWRPTALIAVIANRSDLSDMDKIKLAAKAKMEGNLGDLLPKKFSNRWNMPEDTLAGKLKFEAQESSTLEAQEEVDPTKKWKTVVFSDLPEERKRREFSSTKDNVNSLRAKFETRNMKDNEAYVIM